MANGTAAIASPELSGARTSLFRVFRSEWTKFRSIRSSYVLLAVALVVLVGLWLVIAAGFASEEGGREMALLNPVAIALRTSVLLAQLVIGVWGVTMVTSEYSTGMIRATFAAAPARIPVLIAKALLLVIITVALTMPALFGAFYLGDAILEGSGRGLAMNADTQRALIGASLYLAGVGLFGQILGWLLRHAAGAIATLVGVIILLPVLLPLIPLDWVKTVSEYLPSVVGQEVFRLGGLFDELTRTVDIEPWTGFAIFAAYAFGGLVLCAFLLRRRDA